MTETTLVRLLSLLESRQEWTGPQLAERLGVTTRSIRDDAERLRVLGYPVESTPGGYRLGPEAALPSLPLSDDEAVAVAIGLRSAEGGAAAEVEDSLVRALAKLHRLLPSRLRQGIGALMATMLTLSEKPGSPVGADTLTAIAAACRDHEQLCFGYHKHDGAESIRVTEPHRLVNSGRRWYLVAWDVGKEDWRTFRVDRITLRLPAGPRFVPREMPDEEVISRLSRGLATAAWRYRARVTVFAPADDIADRLPSAITVEPVDQNTCVIDVGSDTPAMLALYLGMLDADFQVDESAAPELAEHLRTLSARYASAAG